AVVTDLIPQALAAAAAAGRTPRFYACGPTPMLMAVVKLLTAQHLSGEVSLDHKMCCGVGGCFACVVKVKDGDSFRYSRSCSEGPVYDVNDIYLGKD
ncbi:MAG: hypothetical protein PHS41_11600, partial [Victivallaceae bacterium]|nr:hypothetical protein [Victivallaceae bacterium]